MDVYCAPELDHTEEQLSVAKIDYKPGSYEPHVYVVRVIDQGRRYIGMRVARGCRLDDLGTRYFTSSKTVKPIWKSSPANILIESRIACKSNHDAILLEKRMIEEADAVKSDEYLNCGYGGTLFSNSGRKFDDEFKEKIRKAAKHQFSSPEGRAKTSLAKKRYFKENPDAIRSGERHHNYGKSLSEDHRRKIGKSVSGEKNGFYGRSHSEETKAFLSESQKGEKGNFYGKTHSPEALKKMSEAVSGEKNGMYGKEFTQEHRKRISESLTGRIHKPTTKSKMSESAKQLKKKECPHCGKLADPGNYEKWHGDKCKKKGDADGL